MSYGKLAGCAKLLFGTHRRELEPSAARPSGQGALLGRVSTSRSAAIRRSERTTTIVPSLGAFASERTCLKQTPIIPRTAFGGCQACREEPIVAFPGSYKAKFQVSRVSTAGSKELAPKTRSGGACRRCAHRAPWPLTSTPSSISSPSNCWDALCLGRSVWSLPSTTLVEAYAPLRSAHPPTAHHTLRPKAQGSYCTGLGRAVRSWVWHGIGTCHIGR